MSRTSKALQASKRNKLMKTVSAAEMIVDQASVSMMSVNKARLMMGRGPILTPKTTIMRVGEITSDGDMVRRYGRTISTVEHLTVHEGYTIEQIQAAIVEGSWSIHDDRDIRE